ncbi:hypothetical protein BJ741DRAFT_589207 [Chytriomyces cf. hyalinus JEL632]|nr:hypothetical protein BJ741DRAFT_589207 [Chytriomyces cf. hyalinus JEL632]
MNVFELPQHLSYIRSLLLLLTTNLFDWGLLGFGHPFSWKSAEPHCLPKKHESGCLFAPSKPSQSSQLIHLSKYACLRFLHFRQIHVPTSKVPRHVYFHEICSTRYNGITCSLRPTRGEIYSLAEHCSRVDEIRVQQQESTVS